jgi:nucleoside-diphosphate-sugar epimerase
MRIALFGVGGFIGSNLVEYLIERNEHDLVGLDVTDDKLVGIDGPRFTFHKSDIRHDRDLVESLVAESDVVVDLIAHAHPSMYVERPLDVIDLDFFENHRIVELCVEHGSRLIQFSTSEIYGHPSGDSYDEDTSELRLGPIQKQRWVYAAAKQLLERIVHGHGLRGDLEFTIIRPFNFVGPRFDYLVDAGTMGGPRLFAQFMSALLSGGPMYLVDGGWRRRSFTDIRDASSAFQTLLDHPGARNEFFNVGNPATSTTVRDIAVLMVELFEELTGQAASSQLVEIDGETFYGEGYEDVDRVVPNIDKMRALGWEPEHDLREIFRSAMAAYL